MWGRRKRDESQSDDTGESASPRAGCVTHEWIGDVERIGSAAVATLTVRKLDGKESHARLRDLLGSMDATGAVHFVLDLQQIGYIDHDCLALLVETLHRLVGYEGGLTIVNSNHEVDYLFRLSQLDARFRLCEDVMSALKAIEKPLQSD